MQTDNEDLIRHTITYVKKALANAEAGHDWFHIERVYFSAMHINQVEKGDLLVVQLASLLHDIADSKFNGGNETLGPKIAGEFLKSLNVPEPIIDHVQQIILNMSYKASLGEVNFSSLEMKVVQDADRLDAIGAIGIARAFTYGGFKNRLMYDPECKPDLSMSKEAYKNSKGPTINHFYEKLLRLKALMNTGEGKKLAEGRHQFMLDFLAQFDGERNGSL